MIYFGGFQEGGTGSTEGGGRVKQTPATHCYTRACGLTCVIAAKSARIASLSSDDIFLVRLSRRIYVQYETKQGTFCTTVRLDV